MYQQYMIVGSLSTIAADLLDLGFPADAARCYADLLATAEALPKDMNYGDPDTYVAQAHEGLSKTLNSLDRERLGPVLLELLRDKPKEKPIDKNSEPPTIDFVLIVNPTDPEKATLNSLLEQALRRSVAARRVNLAR